MGLRISLLGQATIRESATGAVRSRASRTVGLVAFLVLRPGVPVSRQRIAGVFWPDSTDAQALTNLRREVHGLRRALGDRPCLVVTGRDLCWQDVDDVEVDLRRFAVEQAAAVEAAGRGDTDQALLHADAALSRYGGELLPAATDEWLPGPRAELHRQCADLCAVVSDLRAHRGELPSALAAARRRIALEPLEEAGFRALMELQAESGDRAGAVSAYHRCASILERELGVAPSAPTRATLQRIMARGDLGGLPGDRSPAAPREPRRDGTAVRLVGRSPEIGRLEAVWRAAAAGQAGMVLVRGDPGVGKTRLVAELARHACRQGAVVTMSQCFGTQTRLALAPVADWLRDPRIRSAAAALDPVWRDEIARLVPSGPTRGDPAAGSRAMVDAWQRHRFFEGLARAFHGVGLPGLLVLDNLQWCDAETLAFLTFLLTLEPGARLLVVATLRTDQPDDDPREVSEWIIRMRATGALTELTLDPLETDETAGLAEAISGRRFDEDARALLQAATGGFPLHVVEAMRALPPLAPLTPTSPAPMSPPAEQVPPAEQAPLVADDVGVVLGNRLEQTSATAREVAGLAAAVGRDFALELLVEASDLDADTVVRAVDELWRRRIVHEQGGTYDFAHDLLRDTAYAQVSPPRRWLLHRRLAQALELLHAADTGPVTALLAEQYARGGRPDRAVAYYLRAAEVAAGIFAHAEATRLQGEALSIVRAGRPGRERDRQELAVLEAMAAPLTARDGYSSPRLQAVLERSVELAESLDRRGSLVSALVGLWASLFVQGRVAEGHQTVARALALVEPDSDLIAAAHFGFAGSSVSLGMPVEALRHFEIAASTARATSLSIGTRPEVHGRAWSAHAHWLLGHDDRAYAECRAAVALARSIDHPFSLAVALAYAAVTHQLRSEPDEVRRAIGELRVLCDRYGFAYYREWVLILDGWARGGEEGVDLARRGIANLKAQRSFARMPYWLALLAELLASTGRPDAARSTLDAAVSGAQARSEVWWLPELQRMRAAYDAEPDEAFARLRGAASLAVAHGSVKLLRRCQRDLYERHLREHDGEPDGGRNGEREGERSANAPVPMLGGSAPFRSRSVR